MDGLLLLENLQLSFLLSWELRRYLASFPSNLHRGFLKKHAGFPEYPAQCSAIKVFFFIHPRTTYLYPYYNGPRPPGPKPKFRFIPAPARAPITTNYFHSKFT